MTHHSRFVHGLTCQTLLCACLSMQASLVLAAHRQDAGCINSLAALLTSCVAKLLLEPQGSYAAIHGKASSAGAAQLVTADLLCEALLFPVITSTYRSARYDTPSVLHQQQQLISVQYKLLCQSCSISTSSCSWLQRLARAPVLTQLLNLFMAVCGVQGPRAYTCVCWQCGAAGAV